MAREELVKQIKNLLVNGPFEDDEISDWQKRMLKMGDDGLSELLSLLQQKQQILNDADQLFVDMAEELAVEEEKKTLTVPGEIGIEDMKISDFNVLFAGRGLSDLLNKNGHLTKDLEKYFSEINDEDRQDVIEYFDSFIKAISGNLELICGSAINKWLSMYDQFNDSRERKGLDRLNFANQNENVKKLKPEDREVLLRLLKLYDYLLNPTTTEVVQHSSVEVKPRVVKAPSTDDFVDKSKSPAAIKAAAQVEIENAKVIEKAKKIEELKNIAGSYPAASLQRRAVEAEIKKIEKK